MSRLQRERKRHSGDPLTNLHTPPPKKKKKQKVKYLNVNKLIINAI